MPSSLGNPSVQSQSMLVGASRVLCCIVNVYGMQHLSQLSFTCGDVNSDHFLSGFQYLILPVTLVF